MTPFANPLIQPVPPAVLIANISNSYPAVVTTTAPHGFTTALFATINIPYPKVMEQINGKTYLFLPATATQLVPVLEFVVNSNGLLSGTFLNTTNLGPFTTGPTVRCIPHAPAPPVPFFVPAQQAQLIPNGEFITLNNASDIIGPNNPPIPFPGN